MFLKFDKKERERDLFYPLVYSLTYLLQPGLGLAKPGTWNPIQGSFLEGPSTLMYHHGLGGLHWQKPRIRNWSQESNSSPNDTKGRHPHRHLTLDFMFDSITSTILLKISFQQCVTRILNLYFTQHCLGY